jgi:hypothetical protein
LRALRIYELRLTNDDSRIRADRDGIGIAKSSFVHRKS